MVLPILIVVLLGVGSTAPAAAQGRPNVDVQKEAMRKLAFLVGQWSGEATVSMGPGGPRTLRQTEDVQFRLDGLVLLIEGTGRDPETGAAEFNALATIAFDDRTNTYRLRAFNAGNYLETELRVRDRGFEWGYAAGPAKVTNTMALDDSGRWVEATTVAINDAPPRTTVEIRVSK